jgi:ketosteroid isomerase-like protein
MAQNKVMNSNRVSKPAFGFAVLALAVFSVATTAPPAAQASIATDESAIRAARDRSNRAIAAHDLDAAAAVWSTDYVGVSSGNARALSRDDERHQFTELIATRPHVTYLRTPEKISVNPDWQQAGESGRWSGHWSAAEGETRVGGIYFAKWKKEGSEWRIIAETFVQMSCSGTHYCDAPPASASR